MAEVVIRSILSFRPSVLRMDGSPSIFARSSEVFVLSLPGAFGILSPSSSAIWARRFLIPSPALRVATVFSVVSSYVAVTCAATRPAIKSLDWFDCMVSGVRFASISY